MSEPEKTVVLGLGELYATRDSTKTLVCLGLGSCVALALYDPTLRAGGMAHMVLPASAEGRGGTGAKFVDEAVPRLVEEMEKLGSFRHRLIVKLVGGAQVLAAAHADGSLNIGCRNAEAAKKALRGLGLRLWASDLGGSHGRTVRLDLSTGRLTVSTAGGGSDEL